MIASSHEYSNYAVSACIVAKTNWHIGCVEEEHYVVTVIIRTIKNYHELSSAQFLLRTLWYFREMFLLTSCTLGAYKVPTNQRELITTQDESPRQSDQEASIC